MVGLRGSRMYSQGSGTHHINQGVKAGNHQKHTTQSISRQIFRNKKSLLPEETGI